MTDRTTHDAPDDLLDDRLAELGVESETSRSVKNIAPWLVSVAIHVGVIVFALLIAGAFMWIRSDEEPTIIVADFDAMTFDPVVRMDAPQSETLQPSNPEERPLEPIDVPETPSLESFEIDPISYLSELAPRPSTPMTPQFDSPSVQFVGLTTTNARRIVYVIDGSGSMIRSLQDVEDALERSIDALTPQQQFSVVFFQKDEALPSPPGRLQPATRENKLAVFEWIESRIEPKGASNPLKALEYAVRQKPDVIFVLSEKITGEGTYEIDQRDLLARLEELNPADETTGRRPVVINAIQFLEEDELDTLRLIAEKHGGINGYKFVSRADLGMLPE